MPYLIGFLIYAAVNMAVSGLAASSLVIVVWALFGLPGIVFGGLRARRHLSAFIVYSLVGVALSVSSLIFIRIILDVINLALIVVVPLGLTAVALRWRQQGDRVYRPAGRRSGPLGLTAVAFRWRQQGDGQK